MIVVTHDEIRMGDVGLFTDNTIWIAVGEFIHEYTSEDGTEWGCFPIRTPVKSNDDYTGFVINYESKSYIQGTRRTKTNLLYRMEPLTCI